jgi:hypothetical protein
LKWLLRDVLDPAVEYVQHAKQQRERIYNDHVYFTSSKPPENAPSWACRESTYYETDVTNEYEYEIDEDYEDLEKEIDRIQDEDEFEQLRLLEEEEDYFNQEDDDDHHVPNFLQDSAEMNAIRPEDLDELGESSAAGANRNSNVSLMMIFITIVYIKPNKILFIGRITTEKERRKSIIRIDRS